MNNKDDQNNNYLIEPDQKFPCRVASLQALATGDAHKNNANKKRHMLIFPNKLPTI